MADIQNYPDLSLEEERSPTLCDAPLQNYPGLGLEVGAERSPTLCNAPGIIPVKATPGDQKEETEQFLPSLSSSIDDARGTDVIGTYDSLPHIPIPDPAEASNSPSSSQGSSPLIPYDGSFSPTQTQRHVHFRPRVRITSGLRHRRQHISPHSQGSIYFASTSSSRSGSPSSSSSSISAPLRSQESEAQYSPVWGPLGQRVKFFAWKRKEKRWNVDWEQASGARGRYAIPCERTPLMAFPKRMNEDEQDYDAYGDMEEEARLAKEMDAYFGKWPWRLLNWQWWWWQFEPYISCCRDDSCPDY